jgi:uncharacterized integral membrane protein
MKGLKIIPMFLILIILTYIGMLFVEANREEVSIQFGHYQSPPAALGFMVLTSMLVGMIVAGFLCSIELLALFMQNKNLKRRLPQSSSHSKTPSPTQINDKKGETNDALPTRTSGRFT